MLRHKREDNETLFLTCLQVEQEECWASHAEDKETKFVASLLQRKTEDGYKTHLHDIIFLLA